MFGGDVCTYSLNNHVLTITGAGTEFPDSIPGYDDIKRIDCIGKGLRHLPTLPRNLKVLLCGNNLLTELPRLPPELTALDCTDNQILELPNLPDPLIVLNCSGNQLTELPKLPRGLKTLDCANNVGNTVGIDLSTLSLPNTLLTFRCSSNQLRRLPNLPRGLKTLDCEINLLNELPALPDTLTMITCNNNQLQSLPTLPEQLRELICNDNQLSVLTTNGETLPPHLITLNCSNNHLSSLPMFNQQPVPVEHADNDYEDTGFLYLECDGNDLTEIGELPNTIDTLRCHNNPRLLTLPMLPDSLQMLECDREFYIGIEGIEGIAENEQHRELDSGEIDIIRRYQQDNQHQFDPNLPK
jgi:Leucine-rich repeat (LRR) protein